MSIVVPNYISEIDPYQCGKPIKEVAREIGIPEDKIIKLASNENPMGISPFAMKAINDALSEIERYPDGNGYYLKEALCNKFLLSPKQIIIGNGSNDILELAARTFVTKGDQILYSEHAFAVYKIVSQAIGGEGIEAPSNKYSHDLDVFLSLISNKTKLIFIANPNNPTGTLIIQKAVKNFLDNLRYSTLSSNHFLNSAGNSPSLSERYITPLLDTPISLPSKNFFNSISVNLPNVSLP